MSKQVQLMQIIKGEVSSILRQDSTENTFLQNLLSEMIEEISEEVSKNLQEALLSADLVRQLLLYRVKLTTQSALASKLSEYVQIKHTYFGFETSTLRGSAWDPNIHVSSDINCLFFKIESENSTQKEVRLFILVDVLTDWEAEWLSHGISSFQQSHGPDVAQGTPTILAVRVSEHPSQAGLISQLSDQGILVVHI